MTPANLSRAVSSMAETVAALRAAHSDAIASGDPFAELAAFDLLAPAHALQDRIVRVASAALNHERSTPDPLAQPFTR